jgi:hypothetical protein
MGSILQAQTKALPPTFYQNDPARGRRFDRTGRDVDKKFYPRRGRRGPFRIRRAGRIDQAVRIGQVCGLGQVRRPDPTYMGAGFSGKAYSAIDPHELQATLGFE